MEKKKEVDKDKILAKIDELNGYLEELDDIKPSDFEEYETSIEKKRACERLLQISTETIIDVCNILVSGLKLGVPSDEDVLFDKLEKKRIITKKLGNILREIKGFRNVLVHKYGDVKDELVFENLSKLKDFELFKEEVLGFLSGINKKMGD